MPPEDLVRVVEAECNGKGEAMSVGILYHDMFKEHVSRFSHPECPERLDAVRHGLKSSGVLDGATHIDPRPARVEELLRVHKEVYVERVLDALDGSWGNLDPDTFFSPGSRDAALFAAGGGIDLAESVQRGDVDWGWAVVRPPGHHATWERACGFCIFNNIAVAASSLLAREDVDRVAIFDWDVHHGNGTQDQFWDNPNVLFISMHQWPHFPGSGLTHQLGGTGAEGRTVNFPFPAGCSDGDYLAAVDNVALPLIRAFNPQHILVSAGFDAHEKDPLAGLEMTSDCFAQMASRLRLLSQEVCDGKMTLFLEGGYHMRALSESVEMTASAMEKPDVNEPPEPSLEGADVVESTRETVAQYWSDIIEP